MPQKKLYKNKNLQIIFGVTLMAVLNVSSITPAFPHIVQELNISKTQVGLLIVTATLPSAVLSPFLGLLADRFGRKRLVIPALFLFGLAGGACALARDFEVLLALRLVQGLGAAVLGALYVTLVGDVFSGEERVQAMGLNASALSVGNTIYPLIGGALATLSWNYPFLMALAALPMGFIVWRYLNYVEPRNRESLSQYLSGGLVYLKKLSVISILVAAVIAFILSHGAFLNYFSLFLGDRFQASPVTIGVFSSLMALSAAFASWQLGRMASMTSLSNLIKLGFVSCGLALLLIPFLPNPIFALFPSIFFGVGHGTIFPSLQAYITSTVSPKHRAIIVSINATMFRLGQTIGPLIIGLAYIAGDFRGAFLFSAGLAFLTALIGFLGGKIVHQPARPIEPS